MTDNPTAVLYRARSPKRHAHAWVIATASSGLSETACHICGITLEFWQARSRRGRTSLRAGKDAERHIAKAYSGKRTGQFGGPDDVIVGELFVVQSKAGGWFSTRYWDELAKLPRTGGRIPTLIVSERPKPGVHARRLVIRMMSDDVDLHGKTDES